MTQLRHKDPNFTGFTNDGTACFFYIRGCEHTSWDINSMTHDDVAILLDTMIAFYTQGTEAAREILEGASYVPPEERPDKRFRIVHETLCDGDTGEPLAWSNKTGWVDLDAATRFTEEEAFSATLIAESCRVEEIFA